MLPPRTYITCDDCSVTFVSILINPRVFTSHKSRRGTLYIYANLIPAIVLLSAVAKGDCNRDLDVTTLSLTGAYLVGAPWDRCLANTIAMDRVLVRKFACAVRSTPDDHHDS